MRYLINDDDLDEWIKLLEKSRDVGACEYVISSMKSYIESSRQNNEISTSLINQDLMEAGE